MKFNLSQVDQIPGQIGVYLFTKKGKPVYVGKSVNLKARIKSHVENAKADLKERGILENSDAIECLVTDSEFKALVLESELINTHKPRYNSRLKDDKSFLYVQISIKEKYPRISMVRGRDFKNNQDRKSRYFGPFQSRQAVEEILRSVRRIFPYCQQKKVSKFPCFYSKIGLCKPCPSFAERKTNSEDVKREMQRQYKKNIREIVKIFSGNFSSVEKDLKSEIDFYNKRQDYEEAITVRNKLFRFERLLHQAHFSSYPVNSHSVINDPVTQLKQILTTASQETGELKRIECYDISNLSQREGTASMVVMIDGVPNTGEYRKFKIRNPKLRSDFEMLEEVLIRRFKNKWREPDLIVVDGGKPQVRVLQKTLQGLDKSISLIGLAKNPDRLVIPKGTDYLTIKPKLNDSAFLMLKNLRDESHRFAKKYHVLLRSRKLLGNKV